MVWLQVIFFVITNAPSLIRAIRDLMKVFKGDKKVAQSVLNDLRSAQKEKPMNSLDQLDAFEQVILKYKEELRKRG